MSPTAAPHVSPAGFDLAVGDTNQDPVLQELLARPYRIAAPPVPTSPFIFASPHSGQAYPLGFLAMSGLDRLSLRRSEDTFVDELFASAPALGAPLLAAHFPRAYVDANRAESELDPAMFAGPLPGAGAGGQAGGGAGRPKNASPVSARVAAGLGVIPKVVRDGIAIYRTKLPAAEAAFRLDRFYRPYHRALAGLIDASVELFGHAIVVDCHSMPSLAGAHGVDNANGSTAGHRGGYDVVIGDRHGAACDAALSDRIEAALAQVGFSVGRNSPYAGGHTTSHYGQPKNGVQAVQIEISRGLYLDEARIEKAAGFATCKSSIGAFLTALVGGPR